MIENKIEEKEKNIMEKKEKNIMEKINKNIGKVKKVVYKGSNSNQEVVCLIRNIDVELKVVTLVNVTGDIQKILMSKIVDIKSCRLEKSIRDAFNVYYKEYKQKIALEEKMSKYMELARVSSNKVYELSKEIGKASEKERGIISSSELDAMISNTIIPLLRKGAKQFDYPSISTYTDRLEVNIPLYSIKYAKPGDFDGLLIMEYDNSLQVLWDEERIEKTVQRYSEKHDYFSSFNTVSYNANKSKFQVDVKPFIETGDKTTSAGYTLVYHLEGVDLLTRQFGNKLIDDIRNVLEI